MKKLFVTGMLLIALLFVGKVSLHLYGIAQLIGNVIETNASASNIAVVAAEEGGDDRKPC